MRRVAAGARMLNPGELVLFNGSELLFVVSNWPAAWSVCQYNVMVAGSTGRLLSGANAAIEPGHGGDPAWSGRTVQPLCDGMEKVQP